MTAQRRAERMQDVPISITTLGQDALTQANVQQLGEIARITPALRFDYVGAFAQPTIRGVGTAVVTSGGGANVGIYVDGFYSPNPLAADFQLLNVENIQVLKGPQGTLFGRNTAGGAILVSTTEPSTTTRGTVEAAYSSYDTKRLQAYFTTGLGGRVAVDFEALYRASDGFLRNVVTGRDDHGSYDNWSFRTGLNIDLSDTASVLFRYARQDVADRSIVATNTFEQDGFVYAGSFVPRDHVATRRKDITSDERGIFRSNSDTFQATVTLDLDFATVTSYTQFRREETEALQDQDHTGASVFALINPVDNKTVTQELLLSSRSGRLQYTGGLFFFDNVDNFRNVQARIYGSPPVKISSSSSRTRSYAAYLDLTYEVADSLFLTAGARYSHDQIRDSEYFDPVSGGSAQFPDVSGDRVTPRAVLRYELNPRSSVYASFTQGYKAAIVDLVSQTVDPFGTVAPAPHRVEPEKISAFEAGYKFVSRRMSFDLAGYYYDYKDLQVSSYPNGLANIVNAANSRIYGVEAQGRYQLSPEFELSAGAAYLNARYRDFANSTRYVRCEVPACGLTQNFFAAATFDASGFEMQRSPEFTASASARYTKDLAAGRVALSASLYHTSSFFFDLSEQFRQDPYQVLALRAEWTDPSDRFTIAVFADNVTDAKYRTQVQFNSFGAGSIWGTPATLGASVRASL